LYENVANTTNILAYDCFTSPKGQKIVTDKTSYEDNKTPYCIIVWSSIDLQALFEMQILSMVYNWRDFSCVFLADVRMDKICIIDVIKNNWEHKEIQYNKKYKVTIEKYIYYANP